MSDTPKVRDYMIQSVTSVPSHFTVEQAMQRLVKSRHHGFPVVEDGKLVGFVSAKELLRHADKRSRTLREIIRPGTYTLTPDMDIDDAARILFRYGLRDVPVIDENKMLVGIISNLDVIRAHLDRVTPEKINSVRRLLEEKYGMKFEVHRGLVEIASLKPTQWMAYDDELEGRKYEIERGLAEPLIVIKRKDVHILVDGHHRALVAMELGLRNFRAFILECSTDTELGMEKLAREHGIERLEDIKIVKDEHHPLVEATTQIMKRVV